MKAFPGWVREFDYYVRRNAELGLLAQVRRQGPRHYEWAVRDFDGRRIQGTRTSVRRALAKADDVFKAKEAAIRLGG